MTNWFLYLFLKTRHQFHDPRAHMAALGKLFINGGGAESVILQTIPDLQAEELLNLKADPGVSYAYESSWALKKDAVMDEIRKMSPGVYKVYIPSHLTAFIKISDSLGFFLDPNVGIIEISGDAVGEKLYEILSRTTEEIKSSCGDRWNSPGCSKEIYFFPIHPR